MKLYNIQTNKAEQRGTAFHGYNHAGPSGADIIKTSS